MALRSCRRSRRAPQLEIIGEVRAGERFAGGSARPGGRDHDRRAHPRRGRTRWSWWNTRGARAPVSSSIAPPSPHQFINPRAAKRTAGDIRAASRQAARLYRCRAAGGIRTRRRRGVPRGRSRRSSPPATKSWRSMICPGISNSQFQCLVAGRPGVRAPEASRKSCPWPAIPCEHTREMIAAGPRVRPAAALGRRLRGEIRRGGRSAGRIRRGVLLRPRPDPAGPAAGVRPRRGKFFFGLPGNPASDHGHVRNFRARRGGTARRAGGDSAAHALGPSDARFSASRRPDALPAGPLERRWRGSDAGGVARARAMFPP